jgi:HSP20 family protein
MTIRDLIPREFIPWNRNTLATRRGEEPSPFLTLHREMNRLFDDVFHGFEMTPFATSGLGRGLGWPNIEVSENEKELKVVAELPGLSEKDVEVDLAKGQLVIKGEKKTETEDKDLMFSERYYGRFERRIPVDEVDESKIAASFNNGVLTVILPKSPQAQEKVKRIAINGGKR